MPAPSPAPPSLLKTEMEQKDFVVRSTDRKWEAGHTLGDILLKRSHTRQENYCAWCARCVRSKSQRRVNSSITWWTMSCRHCSPVSERRPHHLPKRHRLARVKKSGQVSVSRSEFSENHEGYSHGLMLLSKTEPKKVPAIVITRAFRTRCRLGTNY